MGYFMWPLPNNTRISSKFGPRNLSIAGASKNHKGIDIPAPSGTNILAARSGKVVVVKTGYNGGRGNYVRIQHDSKYQTLYQHCTKLLVKVGDSVSAGQPVATVGNTGVGSGPHLHFEVWVNGVPDNPSNYVSPKDTKSTITDNAISTAVSAVNNTVSSLGKSKVVFIGDSRTVAMQSYVGTNLNIWSCKSSMGLKWMKESGVPAVDSKITSECGVCILLGINDFLYTSPSMYYNYINECAARWTSRGASVYFVSVNPVQKSGYHSITNEKIESWNQSVRSGLSTNVGYIDTYSSIFDTFKTVDGLHYDKSTSLDIYKIIVDAVNSGQNSLYSNSSIIGGSPIQVDYTKLNPYVVTIDRATSAGLNYSGLKSIGVIGAILEAGYLYTEAHNEVSEFKQPRFDVQLKNIESQNLDYGFFFIGRARNTREARSEIYWLSFLVRSHPPKLGVWVKLELTKNKGINNLIIDVYQKDLIRLGLVGKIGFYTTRDYLNYFDWPRYQDTWLLWTVDHVSEISTLQQLLEPEFFDVDGVG